MEPISLIKDADIFENPHTEPKFYKIRPTVKGIVLDENRLIALLSTRGHSLFPGGGVEAGETHEEALVRECKEEIGCDIEILSYLGECDQYRASIAKKYEVHFFVARVVGEKRIPLTEEIDELDSIPIWETAENVENILEEQIAVIPDDEYAVHFNCRTHLVAWKRYLELLE